MPYTHADRRAGVTYQVLIAGLIVWLFGGWKVVICVALVAAIGAVALAFSKQESLLYATRSSGVISQRAARKDMKSDSVRMQTKDRVHLHAVLHHAPDRWLLETVEFPVHLEKKGKALGLDLGFETDFSGAKVLVIVEVKAKGAASEWNSKQGEPKSAKDRRVLSSDVVLEVNGIRGDAERQMQEFKDADDFVLTFQRVHEVQRPTMLYLHGNSGTVDGLAGDLHHIADTLGVNVLAVDYRGYGRSSGNPSEQGLIEDCLCAWRWLQTAVEDGRLSPSLFVYGQQLGGAVAVAMVAELQKQDVALPQGLILESTFTSISALIDHLLPFVVRLVVSAPMQWFKSAFLVLRWETLSRIGRLRVPLLFLSREGSSVPEQHALELCAASQEAPSKRHVHCSSKAAQGYWEEQAKFIGECKTRGLPTS